MTGESESDVPDEHVKLDDPAELLFRQVNPSWVHDGVPSSQSFRPTPKDDGMLSVTRGSKATAEEAYVHHTQVLKLESVGTWAVTVGEATEAGLHSFDQPLHDSPSHGFVDFRGLARRPTERAGKLLMASALSRGRLHP